MMHITIREMIAFAAGGLLLAGAFGCVPGTTSGASLIDGLAALAPTSAVTDPNAPPTVDDLLGGLIDAVGGATLSALTPGQPTQTQDPQSGATASFSSVDPSGTASPLTLAQQVAQELLAGQSSTGAQTPAQLVQLLAQGLNLSATQQGMAHGIFQQLRAEIRTLRHGASTSTQNVLTADQLALLQSLGLSVPTHATSQPAQSGVTAAVQALLTQLPLTDAQRTQIEQIAGALEIAVQARHHGAGAALRAILNNEQQTILSSLESALAR